MEREALLLQSISEQYPDVTIAIENARPYLGEGPYTYGEFPDELKHQAMCINRPDVKIILDILFPDYTGLLMMELRSRYFDDLEESKQNLESLIPGSKYPDPLSQDIYF